MFRPNRIGTPNIHSLDDTRSSVSWSVNTFTLANQSWGCNVINATPVTDFGRSALTWDGTTAAAVANGLVVAIGQQFTITTPIQGDTTGIELNGAIEIQAPENTPLVPIFGRLVSAGGSVLAGPSGADTFTIIEEPSIRPVAGTVATQLFHRYQTQLIMRATDPAGTYFHGFRMVNQSGAAWTPTRLRMQCSVRQLNDQQTIRYRDTLR